MEFTLYQIGKREAVCYLNPWGVRAAGGGLRSGSDAPQPAASGAADGYYALLGLLAVLGLHRLGFRV